ncbi:M16 family metallopeptidase [Streptomyces sp. NPDC007920]|uniref:M16 family metallopeptidase n=1 Tax=Streptomyces sp. NPDC007920 TaxID=3364794 RepID=UPI0036E3D5EE
MTELATMDFHPQPQPGEARPWAFPAPDRTALDNGLTVLRCHRPGQQVVAVEVLLDAPLHAEPAGLDGVATITARAFSEGTDKHTAKEFAAELERCGGNLDAQANHSRVRLTLEVPASRLPKALGLLADALRSPAFAPDDIQRLVRNRLEEIRHETVDPVRRATRALATALFEQDDRMARPRQGTEETVARIRPADVRAFYERHVRPAATTIVVVGEFYDTELRTLFSECFGDWAGASATPSSAPPSTADVTPRLLIIDRPGAVQTHLLMGGISPNRHHRVWPAHVLGTYCLGGSLNSRLDRVLREEKGYTYGMRAFTQVLSSAPDGSGVAMATISGSVDTASTCSALADLQTLLGTYTAHGIIDDERDAAIENLVGVAPLRFETSSAVAGTFADQVEQHLPDNYQAQFYARLAETSAAEASAAANVFSTDRLVTVLVGDASQIERSVRGLEMGEVRTLRSGSR